MLLLAHDIASFRGESRYLYQDPHLCEAWQSLTLHPLGAIRSGFSVTKVYLDLPTEFAFSASHRWGGSCFGQIFGSWCGWYDLC